MCSSYPQPRRFTLAQPAAITYEHPLHGELDDGAACIHTPTVPPASPQSDSNFETRQLNVNVTGHGQHAHTNQQLAQEVTFN